MDLTVRNVLWTFCGILDFLNGWTIATPHAAAPITHFLDCFLDFNDVEATHVRREREMLFLLSSLLGLRLRCLLPLIWLLLPFQRTATR